MEIVRAKLSKDAEISDDCKSDQYIAVTAVSNHCGNKKGHIGIIYATGEHLSDLKGEAGVSNQQELSDILGAGLEVVWERVPGNTKQKFENESIVKLQGLEPTEVIKLGKERLGREIETDLCTK